MSAIVEACDYHGPYPGNFVSSLIATGGAVRSQIGLDYIPVFPARVSQRPWVNMLRKHGYEPRFIAGRNLRSQVAELSPIAAEVKASLIRTHFTHFDLAAGIVARRRRSRCIWTIHASFPSHRYTFKHRVRDLIKVRAAGGPCDRVVAVSDEIARQSVMRGFPPSKVMVIRNGIDVSRFAELPSRDEARAALGLTPDEQAVLAFCWTPHRKGADLIVTACARIGATALLVGTDALAGFLDPMPAHVRLIPPVDDTRWLLAAADVFASASRDEAFPYAIGEAMAARLPVASSDIPGAAAYFGAPGVRTFATEDADGLATALDDLLRSRCRDEIGEGNRAFVEQHVSLQGHVAQVLEMFEQELLAGPKIEPAAARSSTAGEHDREAGNPGSKAPGPPASRHPG